MRRWDARSRKCVFNVPVHASQAGKGAVGNIIAAGSATLDLVVTCGADGKLCVLDPRAELCTVFSVQLTDFPYAMSAAGGLAMCGCGDGSLHVVDIAAGKTLYALGANKAAVRTVHASADTLVCSGDDGGVYVYNYA